MTFTISYIFLVLLLFPFQYCSSSVSSLNKGSSLSVEKHTEDVIVSSNGTFSAGFYQIGENAFSFAIWFTELQNQSHNPVNIVWMANREQPVNGNIILLDAGQHNTWSSNTASDAPLELYLREDGNLVLRELQGPTILWQSYDFPTNTLLPNQPLTRYTNLVSSRSHSNHSSGFYKLFFDDNNVIRLDYDGPDISSTYWPPSFLLSWQAGRTNYNSTRIALLDSLGKFISSDNYFFSTYDYGMVMQRRLTLDSDGNIRVYSRKNLLENWYVSWQVISDTCIIDGICGANSACSYDPKKGKKCSCLPGYKMKNHNDWSYGCEPTFDFTCNKSESTFFELHGFEFYGYDSNFVQNSTYENCESLCLQACNCTGFQYSYEEDQNIFQCYTKLQLLNGRHSPSFIGKTFLRLPKGNNFSKEESISVTDNVCLLQLHKDFVGKQTSHLLKFFMWLSVTVGGLEFFFFVVVCCFLIKTEKKPNGDRHNYHHALFGFRRYSYSELKIATKNFSNEIGRGGGGIVYRGTLPDERHVAIKRLNEAKQGEGEFLAEVSIIGRLNHMNLIEMWGYCAEGKHRLLVYEYMENGSLAENLSSKTNTLDWSKRYDIALGTARVLAYLHEECLEWILHCDIKPQNILLDSNFQPKLADFGLSKLKSRNNLNNNSEFSMIRGTRGYMAPEWISNSPITSKVDVYSYGVVLLDMITGKSPTMMNMEGVDGEVAYNGRLINWVREKKRSRCWVEEIMDPKIGTNCDSSKMEILAKVALECVEVDKNIRPTMSQVVEKLQRNEIDS
ncbi:putative receptor protein kinase ZmPK1 isoform X2 [Medicago truncatula]|uniref:putative receptor protein kinase ZmPK1 isoform X2 n=1 Tax=Medicago truncatula TaxID=3880 RepID=UPI000D2F38EF|nr:putative receptor protein kinase ZmPK1 isoform X2 [Medicago truncatula]